MIVPSRIALQTAEADVRERGFELLGAVSEQHGFMPPHPPERSFPPSHRAWDEAAASLPELWRDVSSRRHLSALPILSAKAPDLPDQYLRRAATVLSFLAHTCWISDIEPTTSLPACLVEPWEEVCRRLGRHVAFMHYDDIITNNWRLKDPTNPEPTLENLDLLIPTVGTPAESVFYLVQVEMLYRAIPLVGGVVRAQEAAVSGEFGQLEEELAAMVRVVRNARERTFLQIDPMASGRNYVDPVVWGSTVANFAISMNKDIPNPGGTAAQVFHLLDSLLGRRQYGSVLGDETVRLRHISPPHLRRFLDAVEEISVRKIIEDSRSRSLRGLYDGLLDVYAGTDGLLQSHRIKAYGYLEIAFKAGREQTLSGFTGRMLKKLGDDPTQGQEAWKTVDRELDLSRQERTVEELRDPQLASLLRRSATADGVADRVAHLVLDVAERGLLYRPGDRLGVLPENAPELVARTVAALRSDPDTPIPLTVPWLERAAELGFEGDSLPLVTLLTHARLRPVPRRVGKALFAVTASPRIEAMLEARHEDQFELWDVLELALADGYDTSRLVSSKIWQDESLARILPPEDRRLYSVSSAPDDPGGARELHLTVETLRYHTPAEVAGHERTRLGAGSGFLTVGAPLAGEATDAVRVRVVPAVRFFLPDGPAVPVAMFAGGTGISPFRGFVEERARQGATDTWLLLGTRSVDRFYYRDELARYARDGHLRVDVAFSREDVTATWAPGDADPAVTPGTRQRIDGLMRRPDAAERLWTLLRRRDEGGEEGYLYVCGQAAFAQSVMDTLTSIARERLDGSDPERDEQARSLVRKLVADRRLMLDVFTTFAPAVAPGTLGDGRYDASELVLHNDDAQGWWTVIGGMVYDLTEFQHLHPGGHHIVRQSAGRDATDEFASVLHDRDSEIVAMASMYKIGQIRRLDFGDVWGIAALPDGMTHLSLSDLFRTWVTYLYFVVETQNSVRTDLTYLEQQLSFADEDPSRLTVQKLMLFGNTHRRFTQQYLPALIGEDMALLWATTVGLSAPDENVAWLPGALADVNDSQAGHAFAEASRRLSSMYRDYSDRGAAPDDDVAKTIARVSELNLGLVANLKAILRDGVRLFEQHEEDTLTAAGHDLVALLRSVPPFVADYYRASMTALSD